VRLEFCMCATRTINGRLRRDQPSQLRPACGACGR
jgi:hypothetical protein